MPLLADRKVGGAVILGGFFYNKADESRWRHLPHSLQQKQQVQQWVARLEWVACPSLRWGHLWEGVKT